MKINLLRSFIAGLLFLLTITVNSQNLYYVSPAGNDTNSGTISQPFKTIQKAANLATAGDTVFIRQGTYRDIGVDDARGKMTVRMVNDGTQQSPIVFMAYPGEKVTLDGSDTLNGWQPCASAADCGNNPNWQKIYYTNIPMGIKAEDSFVWEGDSLHHVAMDPNPADPFYWKQPDTWRIIPSFSFTDTTIVDSSYFTQSDSNYWNNSYAFIWSCNNNVLLEPITSYIPSEHKIFFTTFGCPGFLEPGKDKYAMYNHIALIDHAGEYYIDEQNNKIYAWPHDSFNLNSMSIAVRSNGVDIRGHDYIVIDGLHFQNFLGVAITNYNFGTAHTADGIIIKNNKISKNRGPGISLTGLSNTTTYNNSVIDVMEQGIYFAGGRNNVIDSNYLEHIGATGYRFYGVKNGAITNNTIRDSRGQHANAITTYLECDTILIEGNKVFNCNIGLTFQSSSNITVKNNLFIGDSDQWMIAGWNGLFKGGSPYNIYIHNNTMIGGMSLSPDFTNMLVKDNIFSGSGSIGNSVHSNNLFTKLSWNQTYNLATYNESLEPDLNKIFVDHLNEDFNLKNDTIGSPTVNPCSMSTTGQHVGAFPCSVSTDVTTEYQTDKLITFPNPTRNIVKIKLPHSENLLLQIFNELGALVYEGDLTNSANDQLNIDLNDFPQGIYLVHLVTKEKTLNTKLIKINQ